jgi:two-component system, response regulator YesN
MAKLNSQAKASSKGDELCLLKALVVDDEKTTRDVLVNFLPWTSLGIMEVMEADDGLSALRIASDLKPDIVLSDIRMPKMNGIELAENLQRRLPECRFIFLSGYSDKEYLKSAIRLQAVNYVEKPVNIEEITEALKTAAAECIRAKEKMLLNIPIVKQKLCLSLADIPNAPENITSSLQIPEFELPEDSTYISSLLWLQPVKNGIQKNLTQLNDEVENVINTIFVSINERSLTAFKGEEYIIIHFKTGGIYNKDFFISLMQKLQSEIKASCAGVKEVLAGIGCEVTGRENIYSSFQKSVIAQKRCFFTGTSNVYATDVSLPYSFHESKLLDFSELMKAEKKDEAILFVKRLRNEIQKCPNTHSEYVKKIFADILLLLIRFAEDRNLSVLKNLHTSLLESIHNAPVLEEITTHISALIDLVFHEIEDESGYVSVVSKVSSYILDNYYNEQLSILSIAKQLYLTPNYLSLLFKKETGKTINQYITEVRIDKAKQHLKDYTMKLNRVARSVGYDDAKYFTKVFEKSVGIKPKEFREKHYSENNTK